MKSTAIPAPHRFSIWLWGLAITATAIAVDLLMRHYAVPFAARIPLAAMPLAPGVMFFRELRRMMATRDELEMQVLREALVFVFFALLGVFIVVDLLENGNVLPDFSWNTMKLAVTMGALAVVGTWLANRRYR